MSFFASSVLHILTFCIYFLLVFFLPGMLLLRYQKSRIFSHEYILFSILTSIFVVGSIFYFVSMVFGILINNLFFFAHHVILIALAIVLITLIPLWRKRTVFPLFTTNRSLKRRQVAVLLLAIVIVGGVFTANFDDRNFSDCIYNGTLVNLVNPFTEDQPKTDREGALDSELPKNILNNRLIGLIVNRGQREGNIIFLISFVPLFELFGFNLAYVVIHVLLFLAAFSLIYRRKEKFYPALLVGLIVAFSPILLARHIVDENVIVLLTMLAFVNWLNIPKPSLTIIGIFVSWLIAEAHELALPLFVYAVVSWSLYRWSILKHKRIFIVAFLFGIPTMIHHIFSMGSLFAHESWADFPPIPHSFLGHQFTYHGLLNWPFFSEMVRTPFTPFPTFLMFPAFVIKESGFILAAIALASTAILVYRRWREMLPLAAMTVTIFAYLAIQANWMEPKKMGVSLHMGALFVLGMGHFFNNILYKPDRRPLLIACAVSLVALVSFAHLLPRLDFPLDPRTEEHLPSLYSGDPVEDKHLEANYHKLIVFANTQETDDVYRFERNYITDVDWWPNLDHLPKAANAIEYVFHLKGSLTDLLFSDFGYHRRKPHREILRSFNSMIILQDNYIKMQYRSGCPILNVPNDFMQDPTMQSLGAVRLKMPLFDNWFDHPPIALAADDTPVDLSLKPGDRYLIQSLQPAFNGYYRVIGLFVTEEQLIFFNIFYQERDPTRFLKSKFKVITTENEAVTFGIGYPTFIDITEVRRVFPRRIYTWDGTVDRRGRLFVTPPHHNNR